MFAPPVAKPQEKTAASSNNKAALQRSTAVGHRDGGIAAALALRPVPRGWAPHRERTGPPERETGPAAPAPRLPGPIQAKLKVGAVNDPLEHEADRVADQVMRMSVPEVSVAAAPPQLSRKCDACEEEKKLQRKEAGPQPAANEVPPSVHEVLRSPGQPLDAATRAYFEPRFGKDFSGVRVHADAAAGQSAQDVEAQAYTVGADHLVFGAGRYVPDSRDGQRLLAHELAHVIQQRGAGATRSLQRFHLPHGAGPSKHANDETPLIAPTFNDMLTTIQAIITDSTRSGWPDTVNMETFIRKAGGHPFTEVIDKKLDIEPTPKNVKSMLNYRYLFTCGADWSTCFISYNCCTSRISWRRPAQVSTPIVLRQEREESTN